MVRDPGFRRAVSRAVDREGIARLVHRGRAVPLWGNVSPGNRFLDQHVTSAAAALRQRGTCDPQASGSRWRPDGSSIDRRAGESRSTIVTNSTSAQRNETATLIQADLKELDVDVEVVPLEFRAPDDCVIQTFDYDVSILGPCGGDADRTGK